MAVVEATDGTLLEEALAGGTMSVREVRTDVLSPEHNAGEMLVTGDQTVANGYHHANGTVAAEELRDAVVTLARVFYSRAVVSGVPAPSWWRRVVDRSLDIVIAGLLLLVLLPLLLLLVIVIRISTRGPALYRHVRVGRNGQLFHVLKLRTMVRDADERLQTLLESSAEARAEFEATFKLRDDPRVTPVGRFLRRTSLDELPQLLNVLRGEMSLVGPRPVIPQETVRYGPHLPTVLRVRPGVTGVWQVSGRNDIPYDDRVEMDAAYALHHGVRTNVVVLLKTVPAVVRPRGNGAY